MKASSGSGLWPTVMSRLDMVLPPKPAGARCLRLAFGESHANAKRKHKPQFASGNNDYPMVFSRCLDLRRVRVLDARMEHGDQRLAQAFLNAVQLREGQAAFLELAVQKAFHDQVVNELAHA